MWSYRAEFNHPSDTYIHPLGKEMRLKYLSRLLEENPDRQSKMKILTERIAVLQKGIEEEKAQLQEAQEKMQELKTRYGEGLLEMRVKPDRRHTLVRELLAEDVLPLQYLPLKQEYQTLSHWIEHLERIVGDKERELSSLEQFAQRIRFLLCVNLDTAAAPLELEPRVPQNFMPKTIYRNNYK